MTISKIFLWFCLFFIGGIFLSSFTFISPIIFLGILAFGIFLISVFWHYKKLAVIGFSILFFALGIWRYQNVELKIAKNEFNAFSHLDEKIALIGIVSKEPDIRENNIKLTVQPENIEGKILVTTNRYPEYQYGDKLKISGSLSAPSEDIEGFNYRNYLKKDGIYSVMNWPNIELIGENFGNPLMEILLSFKNKFKESARQFISPPQEGILEALTFGDEGGISKEWKDKLDFTGTRHMAAVSGMNITIIAGLILNFFLLLGLWRQQAFYCSVIFLFLYILMIGAPASAVRAGVMGGLLLLAQYFGRMSQAIRAVIFAAAFMLFLNPLLLKLDVGFQLSFLAILGIIYLQPTFTKLFTKIPNPNFFPIRTTLSTTLAAQAFTLPILIYNFGYIPIVSPITNVLIAPFLATITILIFIFGLAGIIFWPLGYVLSWPTWFALTYILSIIDLFSKPLFTSFVFQDVSWTWFIVFYLALGLIVWRLEKKEKLKFLKY